MDEAITEKEIYTALCGIGNTKATGVDGFNACLFKYAWNIVKHDVMKVVHEFFIIGNQYPVVNCSLVTLIPKSSPTNTIKGMHPISCYSTVYKIISNIFTSRLHKVIHLVVDNSQSAFIPGRIIHDNIILAQELVRGYARRGCSVRYMIQIDV